MLECQINVGLGLQLSQNYRWQCLGREFFLVLKCWYCQICVTCWGESVKKTGTTREEKTKRVHDCQASGMVVWWRMDGLITNLLRSPEMKIYAPLSSLHEVLCGLQPLPRMYLQFSYPAALELKAPQNQFVLVPLSAPHQYGVNAVPLKSRHT